MQPTERADDIVVTLWNPTDPSLPTASFYTNDVRLACEVYAALAKYTGGAEVEPVPGSGGNTFVVYSWGQYVYAR